MIEEIQKLSSLFGPSGKEEKVKEYIKKSIKSYVDEIYEDFLGNLYVKKGKGKPRVLLCSHMDEVGFIINGVEDGYIKFSPVGGIEPEAIIGKKVVFENGRKGVIGYKPFHLQDKGEREKKISFDELVIDVGMKKEAKKFFNKGIFATFDTSFGKLNGKFFKGKAFDDRVGCAILIEIIKNFKPNFELFFLFSSQEETGLRGAKIGAERIKPDIGLIIECTAAGEFYYKEDKKDFPALCKGPVLTSIDRSCIVDYEIFEIIKNIAKRENIPFQYKKPLIGGTDAGNIQIAGKGVKVGIISVPARYIHSPVSIINEDDLKYTYILCLSFLKEIKNYG